MLPKIFKRSWQVTDLRPSFLVIVPHGFSCSGGGGGKGALVDRVRGPCLTKAIVQDLAEILQHVAEILGSMPKHAPQELQEILADCWFETQFLGSCSPWV